MEGPSRKVRAPTSFLPNQREDLHSEASPVPGTVLNVLTCSFGPFCHPVRKHHFEVSDWVWLSQDRLPAYPPGLCRGPVGDGRTWALKLEKPYF